jgi:hypothetical protein
MNLRNSTAANNGGTHHPSTMVAIALLFCASAAYSQPGLASLHGVVIDPSGGLVPGAAVTVTGPQGVKKSTRSDAHGSYQLEGFLPGTYSIRVVGAGFADWQNDVEIAGGQSLSLNVTLTLREQSERVTVQSEAAGAVSTDASSNASALVLSKTDLDALPDDPDDLSADLQALAGPAAGPNGGQVYIDGFTGGRMPPKSSIREIRINQNPFAPQYDHPGQGRVEILTKPGTEDFHGDVLFQFSDAAFNSRNPFVTTKPPYQRRQWEGEATGPLAKNTSFSADFERRDINENAIVNAFILDSNFNTVPFAQAVVTPLTGIEANLKIDRQMTANNTLSVRYGYARDTNDNSGVGNFSLPERGYHQETDEHTIQFVETAVLNSRTVNETRFRFRQQDTDQGNGKNAPVLSVLDAFTSGGSSIGNSFDHQKRYELQNFTSRAAGAHTFRWGGIARGVNLNNQAMQNYAGTFTFTSLASYRTTLLGLQSGLSPAQIRAAGGGASQFTLAAGNPLATVNQIDYGFYFQDDWKAMPNLTISAGLRYEGQTHAGDRSDFGPRLGIAWAPGGKKGAASKNIIRGGLGIFYDRLGESLTLDALRQNGIRQQQFLIENPDFYPVIPSVSSLLSGLEPQTVREADSHWRAPMLLQTSIGWERQLPKHITVASNYIHSIGNHQLRSRNINAPFPGIGARPYGGSTAIYLYESSGIYRQDQWMTNLTARVNSKLTFNSYYVYGHAMSNTDGASTFPANQYDLAGEYGRAAFDVRHRFQINGSWATRWGLRFSPFLTITSGRPYNLVTGRDLNGDGLYTDRPAFALSPAQAGAITTPYGLLDPLPKPSEAVLPRNLGNGFGLVAANLRFSKVFTLGEVKPGKDDPLQIVFSVNARNILNHPNFGAPDGNLSSPLFGQSTALVSGGNSSGNRRLDLQLRFNF